MSVRKNPIQLVAVLLLVFSAGQSAPVEMSRTRDGMLFSHGSVQLLVTDRLKMVPGLVDDGSVVSLAVDGPAGNPAFYISVGGLVVSDFRVDWSSFARTPVNDSGLGAGTRCIFTASAESADRRLYRPVRIEAEVSLTFYEKFPQTVITRAVFRNRGEQRLEISEIVSNHFRLDRRKLEPGALAWDFASYQGASTRWGSDYSLIRLTADYERRNFMGFTEISNRIFSGGGTPLVDIWAPETGLAIASAETAQEWISLPVRTAADGLVDISISQVPEPGLGQDNILEPGESVSTIRGAVIVHKLDFFDPLRTYANLLRAQGVEIPMDSPPPTFEPYWKSWGLRFDFTLEQIYKSLEDLRRVGISWANLDDGWFTWYGDWDVNPAPGKFPGGEDDMRAFVDSVHGAGFKTSLWWYPQGVSPESDLTREHPDWLVVDRNSRRPLSGRGLYYLCPVYRPCIDFIVGQVERIMGDWDYDGLYLDTRDLGGTPPCFNPAHEHGSPLESFRGQPEFYKAIYEAALKSKPEAPVEMCICAMPHDPFKMPYYNVANSSDPINLLQVRRRIKVEKAYRGTSFAVGDCYQVPMDEWTGFSVPESFESAVGTGAQVTTFFTDLTPGQEKSWKRWVGIYRDKGLAWSEYLNLYDLAFDKPEGHVVRSGDKLYYGFFHPHWSAGRPLELRGLQPGRTYRVYEYGKDEDLGTVAGDNPVIRRGFRDNLLLEVTQVE
ncbi:MAG: alpha-galactosidase [Candidatus Glassbacteria bacterium]|nr:alpha-galactosidase [Candidatus Glassbacteria bacterium]